MELRYQKDDISISDYLAVLYRRRWIVILIFAIVMISVTIHTLLATPQYEASGLIEIQDESSQNMMLNEVLQLRKKNPVQAEIEVLKSRTLMELVVRELNLDLRVFDQRPVNLKVAFDELDIHNRWKGKIYHFEFLDKNGTYEVTSEKLGKLGNGVLDTPFVHKDLVFNLHTKVFEPGDGFSIHIVPFRNRVNQVKNRVNVIKVGDNTGLLRILYRSQYPEMARDIVNKIIEIYRRKNIEDKSAEARQMLNFIKSQLSLVENDLNLSEEDLNNYKESHGVMLLNTEATSLIENLSKLEAEKSSIQLEKFQYSALEKQINAATTPYQLPNFSNDQTVLSNLAVKLIDLEIQKKNLLADLTPKHPSVIALDQQIANLRDNIKETLHNSVKSLEAREKSLNDEIAKYGDILKGLPDKERELAQLQRNAAVAAEIYTFLKQKYEEARIAEASTLGNIRIIDLAVVPQAPVSPNMRLNLMLGFLAGLLLAVVVAFFLEFIDDSLKTVEEVERYINRPLYGIIPKIPESGLEVGDRPISSNLVTHYKPKSPISEAFRTMRTNIRFADPDQTMRTLLITSAGPSEGKSTIVSNLAITISNTGRKTVLIDCDLRKPNLHNLFEVNRDPGLTNALSGEMSLDEVIKDTKIENLNIITSGPIPPNPTEMMDSQAMRSIVDKLMERYDMILFDSPPVVAVTDAAILASYAGGTLLVVELGRSRASGVNRAIDLLEKVNANLLGLVTNNIASGFSYDYGYYYYYYYGDGDKKRKKKKGRPRYGR